MKQKLTVSKTLSSIKHTPLLLCGVGNLRSYFAKYGRVNSVRIFKDGEQRIG